MMLPTRAVVEVAKLLRAYDNAVPDVGMGYSNDHWIEEAARRLGLTLFDFDHAAAKAALKGK